MALALLAAGLALLDLPGLARRLRRRLPPQQWARLCALGLLAGGVVVELGAVLIAAPTVLRRGPHPGHGLRACARADSASQPTTWMPSSSSGSDEGTTSLPDSSPGVSIPTGDPPAAANVSFTLERSTGSLKSRTRASGEPSSRWPWAGAVLTRNEWAGGRRRPGQPQGSGHQQQPQGQGHDGNRCSMRSISSW